MRATPAWQQPQPFGALPRVRVRTDLGDIILELDIDRAPVSSAAFLEQVQRGAFNGAVFWRSVRLDTDRGEPKIEVIQAGAGTPSGRTVPLESTSETGLRHLSGAVSLPRGNGLPSSVDGFFICVGDQPALDAGQERIADGLGFAAFAKVIDGMDVVRQIHAGKTSESAQHGFVTGQVLERPVHIHDICRVPEASEMGSNSAIEEEADRNG